MNDCWSESTEYPEIKAAGGIRNIPEFRSELIKFMEENQGILKPGVVLDFVIDGDTVEEIEVHAKTLEQMADQSRGNSQADAPSSVVGSEMEEGAPIYDDDNNEEEIETLNCSSAGGEDLNPEDGLRGNCETTMFEREIDDERTHVALPAPSSNEPVPNVADAELESENFSFGELVRDLPGESCEAPSAEDIISMLERKPMPMAALGCDAEEVSSSTSPPIVIEYIENFGNGRSNGDPKTQTLVGPSPVREPDSTTDFNLRSGNGTESFSDETSQSASTSTASSGSSVFTEIAQRPIRTSTIRQIRVPSPPASCISEVSIFPSALTDYNLADDLENPDELLSTLFPSDECGDVAESAEEPQLSNPSSILPPAPPATRIRASPEKSMSNSKSSYLGASCIPNHCTRRPLGANAKRLDHLKSPKKSSKASKSPRASKILLEQPPGSPSSGYSLRKRDTVGRSSEPKSMDQLEKSDVHSKRQVIKGRRGRKKKVSAPDASTLASPKAPGAEESQNGESETNKPVPKPTLSKLAQATRPKNSHFIFTFKFPRFPLCSSDGWKIHRDGMLASTESGSVHKISIVPRPPKNIILQVPTLSG